VPRALDIDIEGDRISIRACHPETGAGRSIMLPLEPFRQAVHAGHGAIESVDGSNACGVMTQRDEIVLKVPLRGEGSWWVNVPKVALEQEIE
jgi:hypothetical protein